VFAHELAHGLDPGRPWPGEAERERFADVLAGLLLARRPGTVDQAQPSITQALAGRTDAVQVDEYDRVMGALAFAAIRLDPTDLQRSTLPRSTTAAAQKSRWG
jgi:hypothetical protein